MTTIIDENKGFTIIDNNILDRWLRIIGPGPYMVYSVLKRMCRGNSQIVFPHVSQYDWSQYIGISELSFKNHINTLSNHRLIECEIPKSSERRKGFTAKYILTSPEKWCCKEEDMPKPINSNCKFHDPIYEPEQPLFRGKENDYYVISPPIKNIESPHIKNIGDTHIKNIGVYNTGYKDNNKNIFSRQRIFEKEKKSSPVKSKEGEEQNKTYIRLARRLRRIVESANRITSATKTNQWPDQFRKLHDVDKVPLLQINKVLDWYEEHIGQQYVPECFCASSFRNKFPKLELSITRSEKQKPVSDWRSKRKYLNPPGTYGRNVTVIEID